MTSRERIMTTVENLDLTVLSGTGVDMWRDLRIELDNDRVLVITFDRRDGVREAAIENEDGTRRAIRPANTMTVQDTMREAFARRARQTEETPVTLDPARMLTPKRLREIGENALIEIPPSGFLLDDVSQRRIDHVASRILRTYSYTPDGWNHPTYRPELLASAVQYAPHTTGPAEAAQVLAREAIRLAINARLAEITAKSVELTHDEAIAIEADETMTERDQFPCGPNCKGWCVLDGKRCDQTAQPGPAETREVGPMSVDVFGPWDQPIFKVGRWDNEEGAFVHVVSLSREEADALHTALGHTLLG